MGSSESASDHPRNPHPAWMRPGRGAGSSATLSGWRPGAGGDRGFHPGLISGSPPGCGGAYRLGRGRHRRGGAGWRFLATFSVNGHSGSRFRSPEAIFGAPEAVSGVRKPTEELRFRPKELRGRLPERRKPVEERRKRAEERRRRAEDSGKAFRRAGNEPRSAGRERRSTEIGRRSVENGGGSDLRRADRPAECFFLADPAGGFPLSSRSSLPCRSAASGTRGVPKCNFGTRGECRGE